MLNKHRILQLQLLPENPPHLVDQAEVGKVALALGLLGREEVVIGKKEFVDGVEETATGCTVGSP